MTNPVIKPGEFFRSTGCSRTESTKHSGTGSSANLHCLHLIKCCLGCFIDVSSHIRVLAWYSFGQLNIHKLRFGKSENRDLRSRDAHYIVVHFLELPRPLLRSHLCLILFLHPSLLCWSHFG